MNKYLLVAIIALVFTNCEQLLDSKEVVVKFDSRVELTVVNEQNNPIEGALIRFFAVIEGKTIEFSLQKETTDSNGKLVFEEHYENIESRYHSEDPIEYSQMESYYMSDHLYTVIITKDGYKEGNGEIALKDGDDISTTITLLKN